jgi:hypothetical protein
MTPLRCRLRPVLLLATIALAIGLGAIPAAAAIRYAAPGGTGAAPCADHEHPCRLFRAAEARFGAQAGDEIVLAPGTYVDENGDMGENTDEFGRLHDVELPPGVTLHGEAGAARPVLAFVEFAGSYLGGLRVVGGSKVSGITIVGVGIIDLFSLGGNSVAEGVLVTSEGSSLSERPVPTACTVGIGTVLRSSVCMSSDVGEAAIRAGGFPAAPAKLRNVTAVSTGPNSAGIEVGGGTVDAKSVIAEGTFADISAHAFGGATAQVNLDHSDYDNVFTLAEGPGSTATITPVGSGTNIKEPAKLAGDGIHQLAESPTIDKGAVDADSGEFDIDGRRRSTGPAPDIGADEFILSTTTELSCSPSLISVKAASTCTATVADVGSTVDPPLGEATFDSNGGDLEAKSCHLVAISATEAKCTVKFRSGAPGAFLIVAEYTGDDAHLRSSDLTTVTAFPLQASGRDEELPPAGAPDTLLRKLPGSKRRPSFARFVFISDQPNASFECALDKSGFKPCTAPAKVIARPGRHTFSVRAIGPEHTQDPTPALVRWRVPGSRPHKHR